MSGVPSSWAETDVGESMWVGEWVTEQTKKKHVCLLILWSMFWSWKLGQSMKSRRPYLKPYKNLHTKIQTKPNQKCKHFTQKKAGKTLAKTD